MPRIGLSRILTIVYVFQIAPHYGVVRFGIGNGPDQLDRREQPNGAVPTGTEVKDQDRQGHDKRARHSPFERSRAGHQEDGRENGYELDQARRRLLGYMPSKMTPKQAERSTRWSRTFAPPFVEQRNNQRRRGGE